MLVVEEDEDVEDEVEEEELVVSSPPLITGRPSPSLYLLRISSTRMLLAFGYELKCI